MELLIDFPGGQRVDAHFGHFSVETDQEGDKPTPFQVFLASIGTCAGIYILSFCRQRGLNTEGIQVLERIHSNPVSKMIETIDLEIQVPPDFPVKYYDSLVRSAEMCLVKKHLETPPKFNTFTRVVS